METGGGQGVWRDTCVGGGVENSVSSRGGGELRTSSAMSSITRSQNFYFGMPSAPEESAAANDATTGASVGGADTSLANALFGNSTPLVGESSSTRAAASMESKLNNSTSADRKAVPIAHFRPNPNPNPNPNWIERPLYTAHFRPWKKHGNLSRILS